MNINSYKDVPNVVEDKGLQIKTPNQLIPKSKREDYKKL